MARRWHHISLSRRVAVFLAFQSQCFHTDDITGHAIPEACKVPTAAAIAVAPIVPVSSGSVIVPVDKQVRIIAALINSANPEEKNVTILNATPESILLNGWKLADRNKMKTDLSGTLNAGETMKIPIIIDDFTLPKDGGIITLLDSKGLKVDGVSYTEENTSKEGWTIVF